MEKSLIRRLVFHQNIIGISMITITAIMGATINRSLQYNLLGVVTNSNYINYPRLRHLSLKSSRVLRNSSNLLNRNGNLQF